MARGGSTPSSTPSARHEVMRKKLTSVDTQNHAVFAFARAPREAQEKAQKDAAAPTAKGAPGQPSGAPQANRKPRAFDDASTPNVPSDENDAANSPRGGVEEGWYSRASCWMIESAPKPGDPKAKPRSIIPG